MNLNQEPLAVKDEKRPEVSFGKQVHGCDTFFLQYFDTVDTVNRNRKRSACKKLCVLVLVTI